jgi:nucleoside-diphosphate-sugar epimerase
LLIGGSGFIGRSVVARLQQRGHDVIIFHRGQTASLVDVEAERITGNRLEIDKYARDIEQTRPDAVVDFLPWNDIDTGRVIQALNGRVERVVHLSSGDVYRAWGNFLKGVYGEPVPLSEEAALRSDLYPYSGTQPGMEDYDKVLAERAILKAYYEQGYPGSIIRLPMVYGPGDRQNRTWEFVKRMFDRRPALLMSCCRGAWLWHRGYVEDVASGIVLAAERPASVGQVFNIGSRRTLSTAGWARAIGDAMGWSGEIIRVHSRDLPEHLQMPYTFEQHILYDTSKIRRELGYEEMVEFEEGVRRTVEWQLANPPRSTDAARFNYAAEDAAIRAATATA